MKVGLWMYDLTVRVKNHLLTRIVRGSFGSFGSRSVIFFPARLVSVASVHVGSGVFVGPDCWIQGEGIAREPTVSIGNRVSITGGVNVSGRMSVIIGDNVLIAKGVFISDHSHEYRGAGAVRDQGTTKPLGVNIGRDSWLGQGVVVLPGTVIGRGSVVAAYSVVRGEFPERCLLAGNPAQVIRRLDDSGVSK